MRRHILPYILILLALSSCGRPRIQWDALKVPQNYRFEHGSNLVHSYSFADFDAELLIQVNGPGTTQRVLKVFPKEVHEPLPAVVVPYYYPEAMIGCELDGTPLPQYEGITMMADLARMGIASISSDTYHLTYVVSQLDRDDFSRWKVASAQLNSDWPQWSGMGKLLNDARLLVDILEDDPRIDKKDISVAGHSLGGKIAFYLGCTDPRVRRVLCSDFGYLWDASNWDAPWYWGSKLDSLKSCSIDHSDLLRLAGKKPMMILAGESDDARTEEAVSAYPNVRVLNHASGHRPPQSALREAYKFLREQK